MKFRKLSIKGLLLIEPDVFADSRGVFLELFKRTTYIENGIPEEFVQDNVSVSNKDVIRGLHFQIAPHEQGKLVSVVRGAVLDVAVDIRQGSSTFGKYELCELNDRNRHQLWIPPGFAHGFSALEDNTVFLYKCTNYYNKESERGIVYNDSDISVLWGINNPIVSEKDKQLPMLRNYISSY